jgi:two-component system, sensor histidine kinase and response regulator
MSAMTRPRDQLPDANPPVPILVVDDNAAKRLALKAVLLPLGYTIVEADSGRAALRCVMAQDFAVILLDLRMPTMGGFETAALIRLRRQSEMTPIIFITALGAEEIVSDRYAEGAVDFLFAPVQPDELRAKVSFFANLFIKAELLAAQAREVQASADRLRLLTDAAPVGIFSTDAQNHYVYTNPRWTEITGISADEAVGRPWDSIISPEQRAHLAAEQHANLATQPADADISPRELSQRFEIRPAGSAARIVLVTSKSMLRTDGGTAGWVGTLADVTAEAGAEAAMSAARDKATEASRLKSDFLANMSHEIRTPMNGVIGMTDLLLETELGAVQRDYAQTVRNSGEALLTIINDILDYSKVEAGKLEIEDIDLDVRSVVNGVVDLMAGQAQSKDLELVAVIDASVPALVSGDPGRVRQVLTNLIGNAIKFTRSGEVVLGVSVTEHTCDDTIVRFAVTDTGDGIPADKIGLIFAPFVQGDTSTSRRYGGTGLGLAISSQLVTLMGGDFGVSSALGEGSCFWFTIRTPAHATPSTQELQSPDAALAGRTALIVDDNATQRSVLSEYLTGWGMSVAAAESGPVALETLRAAAVQGAPFAVALIDRSMPGMDGLELTRAIVGDPALSPRVVLLTGLGREHGVGDVHESGVCAALSKPVRLADLHACLRVALGLQAADDAPREMTPPSQQWNAEQEDRSEPSGRLLLAEDNLINQKVAVAMLSGVGYQVDTVRNGVAAVQAAAAQPYDAILMDCQMPEMNGYEASAAIRAQEGADRHTPIIALTAGARREDRERCLAAGMDGYLAKPVNKDTLLALVARSAKHGVAASNPTVSRIGHRVAAEFAIDHADFDELRLLAEATEHDFVTELIDQFVSETDLLLVDLRAASSHGDAVAVANIAHSIMGSGGQLGGRRLALSCGRLESKAIAGDLSGGQVDLSEVERDYQELRVALTEQRSSADSPSSGGLCA